MFTVRSFFVAGESWRLYTSYPHDAEHVMPTMLGNVLRRYEILAGGRYNLDTISIVPRLMQVADPRDVAYVHNQRTQIELALRTCALALVATVLTIVAMWQHGLLLLSSLLPYVIAFACYRGAVVVAHEYGTALAVLVDLNRFALYDRMHLPHPEDIEDEKDHNQYLSSVLQLDNAFIEQRLGTTAFLDYVAPTPPPPWPVGPPQPAPDTGRSSP